MKRLFVTLIDISLSVLIVSFFWFVTSWVILVIAIPVLCLVIEHYIISRNCYLEVK
jgi:hypothetical protein